MATTQKRETEAQQAEREIAEQQEQSQLRRDLEQAHATNEALAKSLFEHQIALEEANEMITGLRHRIIDLKVQVARAPQQTADGE